MEESRHRARIGVADQKFILTDYTVAVDENVKGQSPGTMAVTTVGGKIGDLELYVSGMPSFERAKTPSSSSNKAARIKPSLAWGKGNSQYREWRSRQQCRAAFPFRMAGREIPSGCRLKLSKPEFEACSQPSALKKYLFILFVIRCARSGFAYTRITTTSGETPQWSSMPVSYWINEKGLSQIGNGSEFAAIQASFRTWENVPSANVQFIYRGTTQIGGVDHDGMNVVSFSDTTAPLGSSTIAATFSFFRSEIGSDNIIHRVIDEADIVFQPVLRIFHERRRKQVRYPERPDA